MDINNQLSFVNNKKNYEKTGKVRITAVARIQPGFSEKPNLVYKNLDLYKTSSKNIENIITTQKTVVYEGQAPRLQSRLSSSSFWLRIIIIDEPQLSSF